MVAVAAGGGVGMRYAGGGQLEIAVAVFVAFFGCLLFSFLFKHLSSLAVSHGLARPISWIKSRPHLVDPSLDATVTSPDSAGQLRLGARVIVTQRAVVSGKD